MTSPQLFTMATCEDASSPSVDGPYAPPSRSPAMLGMSTIQQYQGKVYMRLVSKGRTWMDFTTPRSSSTPLLCSERVVQALAQESATGYKAIRVEFWTKLCKKMDAPCPYYIILPTGQPYLCRSKYYTGSQSEHRYVFLDESPDEPRYRSLGDNKDWIYSKRVPRPETWDGSDFNVLAIGHPVGIYGLTWCSRRIVDVAAREKWTNVMFQPVDAIDNYVPNHLKEPWPPASFYSAFEPE